MKQIWTIGHSTFAAEDFINLLKLFKINLLADVRAFPGSRRYPHFNKEQLHLLLKQNQIEYRHIRELGGRRKPLEDSPNTAWRNISFRGYADYMLTDEFKIAMSSLEDLAIHQAVAILCSEAVWWRCHRSLIADDLKVKGWTVNHILPNGTCKEHPFTAPAQLIQGKLFYK